MKMRFFGVFLCLLAVLMTFDTVKAQNSDRSANSRQPDSSLEERVTERKAARQLQLDQARMDNIQARCQAAQVPLTRVSDRISGARVRKQKAYDDLLAGLNNLSSRLSAAGINTSDYDQAIQGLQVKVGALNTSIDNLSTAVSDLAEMDCANDPVGFQATLEAARTLRAQTVQSAQEVLDYLQNTVRPTLENIKQQLNQEGS